MLGNIIFVQNVFMRHFVVVCQFPQLFINDLWLFIILAILGAILQGYQATTLRMKNSVFHIFYRYSFVLNFKNSFNFHKNTSLNRVTQLLWCPPYINSPVLYIILGSIKLFGNKYQNRDVRVNVF